MKSFKSSIRSSVSLAIILALVTITIAFAASGDLDTTFSGDGMIVQAFGIKAQYGYDFAIQSDGKIVVAGFTSDSKGWRNIVAARYNIDGKLDTTFGETGKGYVIVSIPNKSSLSTAIAIQSDGKIVLGGSTGYYDTDLVLIRLTTDGILDTSFSRDGIAIADVGGKYNDCVDLVIQGTKIYAVGNSVDEDKDLHDGIIYRFNKNGSLDTTFSGDGILLVNYGKGDEFTSIKVNSGKIYIAGTTTNTPGWGYNMVVARFNDNGFPDITFSGDGNAQIDLGAEDFANDLTLFNDKVIVVGASNHGYDGEVFLLQFTNTGELDKTFSGDGKIKTNLGFKNPSLDGVTIRDGKIIVVGQTNGLNFDNLPPSEGLIARFDAAGNLDKAFSADGIMSTAWFKPAVYKSVAVKGSRIYTVGFYFNGTGAHRLILAAYKP